METDVGFEEPSPSNYVVTDPCLLQAERESRESNKLLPIIKQELRCRIKYKRHVEGKEDIDVGLSKSPKKYELTAEEREKKQRRKEQNRRAAQRCREKKKRMQEGTVENYEMLLSKHEELQEEIKTRKIELEFLNRIYESHIRSGTCQLINSERGTRAQVDLQPGDRTDFEITPITASQNCDVAAQLSNASTIFNDTGIQGPCCDWTQDYREHDDVDGDNEIEATLTEAVNQEQCPFEYGGLYDEGLNSLYEPSRLPNENRGSENCDSPFYDKVSVQPYDSIPNQPYDYVPNQPYDHVPNQSYDTLQNQTEVEIFQDIMLFPQSPGDDDQNALSLVDGSDSAQHCEGLSLSQYEEDFLPLVPGCDPNSFNNDLNFVNQ